MLSLYCKDCDSICFFGPGDDFPYMQVRKTLVEILEIYHSNLVLSPRELAGIKHIFVNCDSRFQSSASYVDFDQVLLESILHIMKKRKDRENLCNK